jgi:hypothetical protein
MAQDKTILKHHDVVYMTQAKAISKVKLPGTKPSSPIQVNTIGEIGGVAPWGDNNLFPQDVMKECLINTTVATRLNKMALALYGSGMQVGRVQGFNSDGSENFVPEKYQPFIDFARRSNINRYLMEACNDFYWFYNIFPEMILTKDRSEIFSMNCQEAAFSRWSSQNAKGIIENHFINGNWENGISKDDKNTLTNKVIDPYNDPVETLKGRSDAWKYTYPLSYPSPGKTYYQLAFWNALRSSGWLAYANSIPVLKKQAANNILVINYVVEVADWYWSWKYPNFEEKVDEQETRIQETYKAFNDFVAGTENAGKTLFIPSKTDPQTFEMWPGWKITAVDKSKMDGILNQDSAEASSHLLSALGWHSSFDGGIPGKTLGAGSGSDIRVAFNMYISLIEAHRQIILEPFYFIRDYNGWDPELQFKLRFPMITTLDKGKETQQQAS